CDGDGEPVEEGAEPPRFNDAERRLEDSAAPQDRDDEQRRGPHRGEALCNGARPRGKVVCRRVICLTCARHCVHAFHNASLPSARVSPIRGILRAAWGKCGLRPQGTMNPDSKALITACVRSRASSLVSSELT